MSFIFDEPFVNLLFNGITMLGLLALYSINKFDYEKNNYVKKIIRGIILGLITMLVMMKPWDNNLGQGEIYDARNIVLSISGVFFGWLSTSIAAFLAIIYRIFVGGNGMSLGIIEIITSSIIGICWPYITKNFSKRFKVLEYVLLGFSVHVISLLLNFIVQSNIQNPVMELVVPYLVVFPVLTAIAAFMINNHYDFIDLNIESRKQKEILNATINATKTMEVYALDVNFNYLAFNDYHYNLMEVYYLRRINEGENFFSILENAKMSERLKRSINRALSGEEHKTTSEIEVNPNKFVEETFSPIYNNKHEIIGVTIFSMDVSEKVHSRKDLEYLSYHDSLTGLYNRRYYEELINSYTQYKGLITVIYIDINGLKIINDMFGHQEGDKLVIEVANYLREEIDEKCEISRVGGDEFVVFLPEVSERETVMITNKIKEGVKNIKIRNINCSISYGVASNVNSTIEEAITLAENRMNRNKLIEKTSHRGANIPAILKTLRLTNNEDEEHANRVSQYSKQIGEKMNLTKTMIKLLELVAKLHNIGKVGIDQKILSKEDELTSDEFEELKRHPLIGFQLLSSVPEYSEIAYDVLCHHERFDGTGYPNNLKGFEIPFRARIISVADAYATMTTKKLYGSPIHSKKEAIKKLTELSGTYFDPEIVEIFIDILKEEENGNS